MERVLSFGKHKGKLLGELDESYLLWMERTLSSSEWGKLAKEVLDNKWQQKDKRVCDQILTFGKHSGKPLKDVPVPYLQWMERSIEGPRGLLARQALQELGFAASQVQAAQEVLQEEQHKFDVDELVSGLKKCRTVGDAGKLHCQLRSNMKLLNKWQQTYAFNLLILAYGRCGLWETARTLLEEMPSKNNYTWNTMLKVLWDNNRWDDAVLMFARMEAGVASTVSCTIMISFFSLHARLEDAKAAFARIPDGEVDTVAWNALISCYARHGTFQETMECFERMEGKRSVVSWNAVLTAYARNAQATGKDVFRAFSLMPQWDTPSCTAVIVACESSGEVGPIGALFRKMQQRDVTSWMALLVTYARNGHLDMADEVLRRIPSMDLMTWNSILACYANHGMHEEALRLFESMPTHDEISWMILVAAFAMKGQTQKAQEWVYGTPAWNIQMWNALLTGFSLDGKVNAGLDGFCAMNNEGLEPNGVTFLCLLEGFSHVSKAEDGRNCFLSMVRDFGIEPSQKHYTCMVDILGRAKRLNEAEELVDSMPFTPDLAAWHTLLGACRNHGDVERSERVGDSALRLDPTCASSYVLVSNTTHETSQQQKLLKMMKAKGARRVPGVSTLKVGNKLHKFVVGDKSHPRTKDIYEELNRLSTLMKEAGYVPNTSVTMLASEEERDREELLCRHSEKLALAFALIETERGSTIEISKNMRMCYDCHDATRFISKLVQRRIVVKDASRIHRFEGGACSCGELQ